ncbi:MULTISPECIES: bifunctional diguanylate cyclase/phosphodiesterase [unclassified Massilia]|uniref:putative bifunctional diguanylate cyclase/phosphodiesterase n=1 Tax=unclassified Massilia TaxID=2609279 RepID=UPI00177ACC7C|nr:MULTISPECIES: EAL domain-containing protein [unclassified Massilia]MBD8530191.1 EAL domain-containing protein [Massilia sp. CFBP 13647]MBD8673980.1 EAL domain-containing protein [Massilia sp. CFBP 13721]
MLKLVTLLLPRTLVGRVFTLFALSMLVFVGVGLGMFYRHQYLAHIEETQDAANTLIEVAARAVEDSAVIGDYDTVRRTLATMMLRSPFQSAVFIDLDGGTIQVRAAPDQALAPAPAWLSEHVAHELYDVNRVVNVGGTDYGVLRLHFDEHRLASQLWLLLVQSALLAGVILALSLALARALLARWLKNLGRLRFDAGDGEGGAAISSDTPLEIREAILAVNRSAASMRDQYGQRIDILMDSLVQHKSALDQAAIVCEVDRAGLVIAVNDQFVAQSGYAREELVGRPLPQAGNGWTPARTVWRGEVAVATRTGERQWYRTIVPIFDTAAQVEKYICIDVDISERKQFEDAIVWNAMRQGLLARLGRKALEGGPLAGLFDMAAAVACEGLNVRHAALFGFDPAAGSATLRAAHGFPAAALGTAFPCAPDAGAALAHWSAAVLGFEGASIESAVAGGGRAFGALAVYAHAARTFQEDEDAFLGSLANILASAVEREEARKRLTWLAQFDTLTGLPNRHRLGTCLEEAIAGAALSGERAGVMFIDLDRFKSVNDMLGHSAGDALLAQAGARLQACVGAVDVVARLGGDEFAVVLPQLAASGQAEAIAQSIVEALAQPFLLQGQQLFVSASVGIAAWPEDGIDAATLLKNADTAMYSAKQDGRNNYRFYRAEMNANAALRLQTESQLHLALERGEFELHYQPKVKLAGNSLSGFEALLRWHHPERGLVAPIEFISILEETGLILPVGEWIITEVCRQVQAWSALHASVPPVAINLSARQLAQAGFAGTVRGIVADAGIDPCLLEFELTESMLMADPESAVRILSSLKAQGMRLSVDDFGTGYSSLAYLKRFPLDALKIDRTFVRDLPDDADDAAITKAVISLAHSLNLKVVAEGVETIAHLDALRAYGCDEIQGYYISKPLPADKCGALLNEAAPLVA